MRHRISGKMIFDDKSRIIVSEKNRNEILYSFPSDDDERIPVYIYGKERMVSYNWIRGVAIVGLHLPDYDDVENNVYFIEQRTQNKPGGIVTPVMCFHRPYLINGLRLVPNATSFAVSRDGKRLVNWQTGRERTQFKNENGYYCIGTNSIVGSILKSVNLKVHRLVAYAWVENSDSYSYSLVNHLNGIRTDNRAENLEWTDTSGNTNHAIQELNAFDKIMVKWRVRDTLTGAVHSGVGLKKMLDLTGSTLSRKPKQYNPEIIPLYMDRYEIRVGEYIDVPWFFENIILHPTATAGSMKAYYIVTKDDGEKHAFFSNESMVQFVKHLLKNKKLGRVVEVADEINSGNSGWHIDVYSAKLKKPITLYDTVDEREVVYASVHDMLLELKCSYRYFRIAYNANNLLLNRYKIVKK